MNNLEISLSYDPISKNHFIDFIIDNTSLFERCDMYGSSRIGSLGWGINSNYENELISQFQLKKKSPELESNRVMIFVCSECGDIGCGATTIKIEEKENEVFWSNFGDEDNIEKGIDFSSYLEVGPFKFEKIEYHRIFNSLLK